MQLKPESLKKIDDLISKYPEKRSCVLPLLHIILEEHSYIPQDAVEWVASKLDLQPINVYEVVTFYPMLKEKPQGKKHVKVCRTLSCALRGAYKVCEIFKNELNCELGQTTANGAFSLEFVECLASCGTAPVVQINEDLYENCSPEKVSEICKRLKQELSEQLD